VWSRDGRLLEVNTAWESLLGLKADDLSGFRLFEDAQMRASHLVPLFERSFFGERVVFPVVLFDPRGLRSGSTPRWLRTLPLPVRDARGKVSELIVVHEVADESERLQAARRLETLGVVLPPDLDPRVLKLRGPLSPREREVLLLVAEGFSNKQIAKRLGVAERTAKFHVTSVLNKLGADTRARAVAVAVQQGLV
jgi:DNA-binding CsgD family transcriptional regulator